MTVESGNQVPVKIHLRTRIQQDHEEEQYELILFGNYYQKGNTTYLKYDEVLEEGTVHTIVKIAEQNALILRSGALKMRLSFQLHNEKNGSYESQYGTLLLSTKTKVLDHNKTDQNEGRFLLKYDLLMNGETTGEYEMAIQYKEA